MNTSIQKEETSDEAQLRERLGKEARRRLRLERQRASGLRVGEEVTWSKADLKALARADEIEARGVLIQSTKGRPATRARSEATAIRLVVKRDVGVRMTARQADLRLDQTVALDAMREEVDAGKVLVRERGQKRLVTRDGLKMLRDSGAMTPKGVADLQARIVADRRLAVGLTYRAMFEVSQASLRSCLATPDGPPPSKNLYVQARSAQRRAALAGKVKALDLAVVRALGEEALLALRSIAGEARTVNSITTSARRRERLKVVLVKALDVVGDGLAPGS